MHKHFILILFIPVLICGCSYNATVTLYKTPEKLSIGKIGFVDVTPDSIPTEIYEQVNRIYCASVSSAWKKFQKDSACYLKKDINYYKPDTAEISRFCKANHVDGIIISSMKFTQTNLYIVPVPVAIKSIDADLGMKLYDDKGRLLISNSFNTQYGSSVPRKTTPIQMAVEASVTGAVKGVLKEMKTPGDPYF